MGKFHVCIRREDERLVVSHYGRKSDVNKQQTYLLKKHFKAVQVENKFIPLCKTIILQLITKKKTRKSTKRMVSILRGLRWDAWCLFSQKHATKQQHQNKRNIFQSSSIGGKWPRFHDRQVKCTPPCTSSNAKTQYRIFVYNCNSESTLWIHFLSHHRNTTGYLTPSRALTS